MKRVAALAAILCVLIPSNTHALNISEPGTSTTVLFAPPIGEILSMRTEQSQTTYLGNGVYASDSSISAVHYKDAQGNWQNIDNTINHVNAAYAWQTAGNASFQTNFTDRFNAGMSMKANFGSESISLQPYYLQWTNNTTSVSNTGTTQFIAQPQAVLAGVSNPILPLIGDYTYHAGTINWDGAYGAGTHFQWQVQTTRITKTLKIDSLSNLPPPNAQVLGSGDPVLRLTLFFLPSSGVTIWIDGSQWDKATTKTTFNVIEFKNGSGQTLWGFDPLEYWDSSGNEGQSVTTVRWTGAYLSIEIRVPYSWLQTANFPVYLDTNIDAQVAANNDDGGSNYGSSGLGTFTNNYNAFGYNSSQSVGYAVISRHNVTIPVSATITTAYENMTCNLNRTTDTVNIQIAGDKQASPVYVNGSTALDALTKTTAKVNWNSIPHWTAETQYQTPDISTVIQELVNTYDYSTGRYMGIMLYNNGSSNVLLNLRSRYDYGSSAAKSAILHIEYTSGWSNIQYVNGVDQSTINDVGTVTGTNIGTIAGVTP